MRIFLAFVFALCIGTSAAFAQESVEYDPATGNIVFKDLDNAGSLQVRGPGVPANTPGDLGGLVETDEMLNQVTWAFLLGSKNGDLDGGPVFPTNLLQSTLDSDYFAGVVITGSGNSNFRQLPISGGLDVIPEPSTLLLSSLGLVGLAFRRRRNG